ncbi:MAG: pantoate--beta-alanine ligase [Gemmatimonadetes bacterium]|nr:pantoate--beta-alanine ligase [Gemmatimonadota bacterium]
MIVARTRAELARGLASLRVGARRLGLVPTMGYLHEGHLSLVDLARASADVVAASVFVNPIQFGPDEDIASYPRDPDRDLAMLAARGAQLAFLPGVEEMYPLGEPRITVDPGADAGRMCGAFRPGHFRGVLTVVAKLFGLFRPEVAVFGRKDLQQLVLIERMNADLDMGVEVVGGAIVREPDGLAMSSRNSYLSADERRAAPSLQRGLLHARTRFQQGERSAAALLEELRAELSGSPLLRLQYAEVVDPSTLDPADHAPAGAVLALAAFCGRTRLIDNVVLDPHRP